MTKFRDLAIGDHFDFVGPNPALVSFHERCTKISARRYSDESPNTIHHIGSVHAEVYHVVPAQRQLTQDQVQPFIGTIHSGSLKADDVVPALLTTLHMIEDQLGVPAPLAFYHEYLRQTNIVESGRARDHYDLDDIWSGIEERVNEYLPEGWYCGAIEGDGADFGIWQIEPDETDD